MSLDFEAAAPPTAEPRRRYRPSDRVAWGTFLPWAALALLAAAGAGYGLYLTLVWQVYVGFLVPLAAAIPALVLAHMAVRHGRCRSRAVAMLLGAGTVLVLFGSSYYVDMLERRGVADVTELPEHFLLRTRSDRIDAMHKGWFVRPANPPPAAVPPSAGGMEEFMRWYPPVFEIGMTLALALLLGFLFSSRPFSEESGRWMVAATAQCPPDTGPECVAQLASGGRLDATALDLRPITDQQDCTFWTMHYAPAAGAHPDGTPVYLSLTQCRGKKWPRRLVKQVELQPEEAAGLVPLFPTLLDWAGVGPRNERAVVPVGTAPSAPLVQPVSEPYGNQILTPAMAVWRNLLGLVPLFVLLAPLGVGFWLINNPQWVGGIIAAMIVATACVVGGFVACGLCLLLNVRLGTAYLVRALRRRWRGRPDAIVSPDEPGVLVVEVIPRRNWQRPVLESADDVGLLVVDPQRRELRFEGDKERYCIPIDCVESCTVELFFGTGEPHSTFGAVMQVRSDERLWEVPWYPLAGVPGCTSRERAQELRDRILGLRHSR
jgi:hypothetical protein